MYYENKIPVLINCKPLNIDLMMNFFKPYTRHTCLKNCIVLSADNEMKRKRLVGNKKGRSLFEGMCG